MAPGDHDTPLTRTEIELIMARDSHSQQVADLEKRMGDQFEHHRRESLLVEKAFDAYKMAIDNKLAGMNEMRSQIDRAESLFVQRREHDTLVDRISRVENKQWSIVGGTGAIVVGIGILLHFIK